jgi:mono/diheme cytochrome c family protein
MRHVRVRRLAWLLSAVFAAGAVLFAATRPDPVSAPAPDAAFGQAAFEARCGYCHGPDHVARWGAAHPEPEARRDWLDRLLRHHHPPPEVSRQPIIDHIEAAIAEIHARD